MKTVTIIDTGISTIYADNYLKNRLNDLITYKVVDGELVKYQGADDVLGHGTLVCSAINTINKDVAFNVIKAFGEDFWADEKALVMILKDIERSGFKTDILHISSGIQVCESLDELEEVLWKIRMKGTVIVSAFSNNQVFSYPAACSAVIGVMFDTNIVSLKEWIYVENSPINIFATGHPKNLVDMNGNLIKTAGASFSAGFITGHIAKMLQIVDTNEIYEQLKNKAIRCYNAPEIIKGTQDFEMNKIVVFPFNKENHSLVRNYKMLSPELVDILDVKYSPYIGLDAFQLLSISDYDLDDRDEDKVNKCIIKDIMKFDWNTDFDTFVLGHVGQLNDTLFFSIYEHVYDNCIKHHKNLYSYDPIPTNIKNKFFEKGLTAFHPQIIDDNITLNHCGMLYEISKPVVGVFGTSSKQGKWSLQLKIREILEEKGYRTGHLGTEPHSLLFHNTQMCAIGFNSEVKLNQTSAISLFNYLMHTLERSSDILLFGTQSNVIPYSFGGLATIPIYTYELICACEPQASILCVNEWDEIDYIKRCIQYLESFCGNKVIALAYFFKDNYEKWDNSGLSINELKYDYSKIEKIKEETQLPTYNMGDKNEVEMLCDDIIAYF